MRRICFACLFLCLIATFSLSQSNPFSPINQSARVVSKVIASQADPKAQARILDSYGKLPLSFEANQGQTDGRVKFLSRTSAYTVFLTADEVVLALRGRAAKKPAPKGASAFRGATVSLKRYPDTNPNPAAPQSMTGGVLRMKLRNANPAAKITGTDELAGTSNYFIGDDPTKWRTNVPTYAKVKCEGIYSGIDLVYYGNHRQLEYDFIVAPGADPRRIAFGVRGAKRIRQDAHGDLVFKVGEDEIRGHKPVVYQEKDGARQLVAARYAVTDTNRVGFEVAKYDTSRALYIDPLIYSTYLGGSGTDVAYSIAVDSAGNAYVTGYTTSTDFPTMNPLQTANGGAGKADSFVTKINAAGSALVYSTYLGGGGDDYGHGIAVDSTGNVYVTGSTTSTDFPTMNPLQTANGGAGKADSFVTKINAAGSALIYSTYLGGSGDDYGHGIALDSTGDVYVTGSTTSTDFPTMNPLQTANGGAGKADSFVTKINATGSALIYSTYLGGSGDDYGSGIALDSAGNAYVTGYTTSTDFPVTAGAFQTVCAGADNCATYGDAFVTKINPTGSALVYSTYLGGTYQDASGSIAVDSGGNAYVTGFTDSNDFPVTPGAFETTGPGYGFVSKFDPTGSTLIYSTYLNGSAPSNIAIDSAGNAYVTGSACNGFPLTPGAFQTVCRRGDAFVTRFNSTGSALVYSTYLGGTYRDAGYGISVDSVGNAYVTGFTDSPASFPTKNPIQGAGAGGWDAFVTKIDVRAVTTTTLSSSPNPSTYGQAVTFTGTLSSSVGAPPDGETVKFRKGTTVLGTGTLNGGSASFTTSVLPAGTNVIKAVYGGDSNFAASTSKAVSQVVNKATTTTTLASSQNPSNFGQSVTFTASVTPQFGGTVTGSVTFSDGTTALKTVALSGGVAKFTISTLTSGAHNITATYNGSTSFIGSSASLTQTVN